jgi:hypothetical protein
MTSSIAFSLAMKRYLRKNFKLSESVLMVVSFSLANFLEIIILIQGHRQRYDSDTSSIVRIHNNNSPVERVLKNAYVQSYYVRRFTKYVEMKYPTMPTELPIPALPTTVFHLPRSSDFFLRRNACVNARTAPPKLQSSTAN